jgi:DNA-binding CsgD family transcriptional regulator
VKSGVAQESPPLVIEQPQGRLIIRRGESGTSIALFFDESVFVMPLDRLVSLGLAPREAEVFQWFAQGKAIPEIAAILSIGPRTVSKLLTRAYRQLGVENRHATVATALEAMRAYTHNRPPSRPSR